MPDFLDRIGTSLRINLLKVKSSDHVFMILVGALIGIAIPLLEKFFPKCKKFLPSPTGLGIAMITPAFNSISMFIGALIAWIIGKRKKTIGERYTVPVASGIIAGESLMGIAVAIAQNALRWIP